MERRHSGALLRPADPEGVGEEDTRSRPSARDGGGRWGGTQMSWDERLGIVVVRTPVWEASKEKSRYFHPANLPQALCPH